MAVAYDSVSSGVATGGVTSLTWAHTTGAAGAFRYMVVAVGTNGQNPTGVTYAAQALTLLGSTQETDTGHRISLWGIKQPGTGTNNVIVTMAGSTPISAGAVTFTGVDQGTATGTYAGSSGNLTSTPNTTVSSDADEMVVCGMVWNATQGAATSTPDAAQTFRWKQEGGNFVRGAGSTEPGAATVSVSYTMSVATNWAIGAISLKSQALPSKGTLSRVVIPLHRYHPEDLCFVFDGWQRGPSFDPVYTSPNDFFCGQFLG